MVRSDLLGSAKVRMGKVGNGTAVEIWRGMAVAIGFDSARSGSSGTIGYGSRDQA